MFKMLKSFPDRLGEWAKRKQEELKVKTEERKAKGEPSNNGMTLVLHNGKEIPLTAGKSFLVMTDIIQYGLHSDKLISVNGMRIPLKSISYYYDTDKMNKSNEND